MPKCFGSKRFFLLMSLLITVVAVSTSPSAIGALDERPLLSTQLSGVDATSDRTLDITLPLGVFLSGTVRDARGTPLDGGTVTATSQQDASFSGNILPETGSYRIALPPGIYRVSVQRPVKTSGEDLLITSQLVEMIPVQDHQILDLIVSPPPATVMVSGNVTNPETLPGSGLISFSSVDQQFRTTVSYAGSYRAELPADLYDVVARLEVPQPEDLTERLSVILETISIDGTQPVDLRLPGTVTLSGAIQHADGTPAVPSVIIALDLSNFPLLDTFGLLLIPETSATGAYWLTIPPSSYIIVTNVFLDLGDGAEGRFVFPTPSERVTISTDQTMNFTVPPSPSVVTISGTVTDEMGQPVAGARVAARTIMVTNTPSVAFQTATEADSEGRYNLRVLSGTNFTVTVTPPAPTTANTSIKRSRQPLDTLVPTDVLREIIISGQ